MDKKVRWGLMSTARINQKVMPSIKRSDRGELTAVASRDLKKAKKYARKNNIPHFYGSYEELLASPEIDAVYISHPGDDGHDAAAHRQRGVHPFPSASQPLRLGPGH